MGPNEDTCTDQKLTTIPEKMMGSGSTRPNNPSEAQGDKD